MGKQMEIFAKLDENNFVIDIIVVDSINVQNLSFPESEAVGIAYLNSFLPSATWKQSCPKGNFRFRYAGIGYKFNSECGEHGGFSSPKPAENFVWDSSVCNWIPPVPYPQDETDYYWNFSRNQWSPTEQDPPETTFIG